MIAKSIRNSLNLYFFLGLSIISLSVFAGVDPEEANMEDNIETQETVTKEVVDKEIVTKENLKEVKEELVKLTNSCISFPVIQALKSCFSSGENDNTVHLFLISPNRSKTISDR